VAKTATLLQHNFNDGQQDLPVLSGNGAFTEPGGVLQFDVPGGTNADWWTSGRNGKAVVSNFGQIVGRYNKLFAECTFTSFSGNTYNEMYFNLYKGDVDWYQLFVTSGGTNLQARRMVGAGVTNYASVATPTYPFKVRLVWDVASKTIEFQYDTIPTSGGWITLQSAVDIGSFVPESILFGGKNWSSLPVLQCKWDDALVTAEYTDAQRIMNRQDGDRPAQVIDEIDILSSGGPSKHELEDQGVGQRIPGPVDQPVGSVGPFDVMGPSDSATPLPVGGPRHHSPSVLSLGQRVPGPVNAPAPDHYGPSPVTGLSDRAFAQLYENLLRPGDENNKAKPANRAGIFEEFETRMGAVPEFNPYTPTVDPDGHVHLESGVVFQFYLYDTRSEVWADPTSYPDFTGYARDGTHYTNGVQDAGPVYAPWYLEAGGGGNAHRSARGDFPALALIGVSQTEVIIYDLDTFPTSLRMWMRWQRAQSSSYFFHGRGTTTTRDVKMVNGVLYTVANYTSEFSAINGHLTATDFKRDGDEDAHHLIRADNHHKLVAGKDITDRNTTTWWSGDQGKRLQNEYCNRLDVWQDPSDWKRHWVAIGGEDMHEVVEFYENVPQDVYPTTPTPTANIGNFGHRGVVFDASGQLWCSEYIGEDETRIWRNGFDYQGGVLVNPFLDAQGDRTLRRYERTIVRGRVFALAAARQYIYAAVYSATYEEHLGVWAIDRNAVHGSRTLTKKLAYTIANGGGEGVAGLQGEIMVGDKPPRFIRVWNQQKTSYLMIASLWGGGGVTIVRLRDDQVMLGRTWNTLQEDGSYVAAGWVT
jgi:hypothetical protein